MGKLDERTNKVPHFQGGFGFWVAPPCRGVAGTETLMEQALDVTRGLRKVTPDREGLASRGPFTWWALVGVRPVVGEFR